MGSSWASPSPAAHDPVFQANPVTRGQNAGLSDTDTLMAIGTGGLTFNSSLEKANAKRDAEYKRRQEMLKQDRIDSDITRLRDSYGFGDTAMAQANKSKMDSWLNEYQGDNLAANNEQLDAAHMNNELASRRSLASQGLLGGSVDAHAQRRALSAYVSGRQRAVAAAKDARTSVETGMTQQRMGIEQQLQAGTEANPDWKGFSSQQHEQLDSAHRNIIPEAFGNAFTTAGNVYREDQLARGRGGQGVTVAPSRTSSSGNITGG